MKKYFILLLCTVLPVIAFCQKEVTKFFDANWKPSSKESAKYVSTEIYKDETGNAILIRNLTIDGQIVSESEYADVENGVRNGRWTEYHENGQLKYSAYYVSGNLHGDLKTYYPSGQLKRQEHYKIGTMFSGKCFNESGQAITFFPYEVKPEPLGGIDDLYEFITENLKYPRQAMKEKAQGKVVVAFTIDEMGNVSDIQVVNPVHPLLDEEALRIISLLPKWSPAKLDGVAVKIRNTIPLTFKL